MQQPLPDGTRTASAPSFALIGRQRLRPGVVLLAILVAAATLAAFLIGMERGRRARAASREEAARAGSSSSSGDQSGDNDPNQVDTIVLGSPSKAPVPGRRPANSANSGDPVHPFVVVHLPRYDDSFGKIPATDAGQLLYQWLGAFNRTDPASLATVLPAPASTLAAELVLRRETGGFTLQSAREIEPGLLVFRLHDQTKAETEVLGTLQLRPGAYPPAIGTFSLRAVPPPAKSLSDKQ